MEVTLERFGADEADVLDRLMALYVYDLAELPGVKLGDDARFLPPEGARWVADPGVDAWKIRVGGALGGFALAAPADEGWFLDDFFVLRTLRRGGVGAMAADAVFAARPGPWSWSVRAENGGAMAFWRRARPRARAGEAVAGRDGHLRVRWREG